MILERGGWPAGHCKSLRECQRWGTSPLRHPLRLQLPPSCGRCRPLPIPSWERMQLDSAKGPETESQLPWGSARSSAVYSSFPQASAAAHAIRVCGSLCLPSPTEQVSPNRPLLSPSCLGREQTAEGQNQS